MHIVVCIKQVPDSAQIRVHPVTNTIMRQGVPTIINPYDLFSLEEALRLRDKFGGKVTVITMGPPMAIDALRKALAIGGDAAVLLSDRVFAGSDTLATSFALATAIKKLHDSEPVDIVFCGKQTIDGDTAQVGPGIAKRLELNQLTYVERIDSLDLANRRIVVERRGEGGLQVLSTKLPCLITMLEGTNRVRRGTMADMLRAARTEIPMWSAAVAGIDNVAMCGLKGSPTVVKKVFAPQPRKEKAKQIAVEGKTPDAIAADTLTALFAADARLEETIFRQAHA